MKKCISLVLLLTLLLSFSMVAFASDTGSESTEASENHKIYCDATLDDDFSDNCIIVVINKSNSKINKKYEKTKFRDIGAARVEDLTAVDNDVDINGEDSLINTGDFRQILKITLKKPGKKEVLKAIKKLEKRPEIESAEPNYLINASDVETPLPFPEGSSETSNPEVSANDPMYSSQYALQKISASAAWDITTGGSVRVGIIDTGIAVHPDLKNNLLSGWDFYSNNATTDDVAEFPHGTHVAGIVGAVGNNGVGISGVNWRVSLIPLQVVITSGEYKGKFDSSAIISAINYSYNNFIPIINCSFGSYTSSNAYDAQMRNYGGLVVCSAGNLGADTDIDANRHYPSCSTLPNVVSVAASDENDEFAVFSDTEYSNFGKTSVDLLAPGKSIISTVPSSSYARYGGTSMAAPYVTGVAALIKSVRPDLTSVQIKHCILEGVDKFSKLSNLCVTGGRLNAKQALDIALAMPKDKIVSGDFNGDGKDDVLRFYDSGLSSIGQDEMQMSVTLGGKNQSSVWYTDDWYSAENACDRVTAGDFNGDGKDDIAAMYYYDSGYVKIHIFLSTGSSFKPWQAWYETSSYKAENIGSRFVAGDFNGDGKDDLAAMYAYNGGTVGIHVWTSTGSSLNNMETWYYTEEYNISKVESRFVAGDFNGDGKDDLANMYNFYSNTMGLYVFPSSGSAFSRVMWHSDNDYDVAKVGDRFVAGDFNGDGRCDLAAIYDYGSSRIKVHVFKSTVSGFPGWDAWLTAMESGSYTATAVNGLVAGDFNGDSKCDLVSKYLYASYLKLLTFTSKTTSFTSWNPWIYMY